MSQKHGFIIFGISVTIGVILRSFMLIFIIDHNNGFIKNQYIPLIIVMAVLLLVAAALVFFVFFYQKKNILKLKKPNRFVFAISEALMAAAIIYEAFVSPLLDYITGFQLVFHKVTSLISAAALIYMCACRFTKMEYPKIITIAPVLFWLTRVITVFTEFATLATVTDTVLETISMCLALVVFLSFSKQQCGVEIKNQQLNLATTVLCGYFCALSSVPRFICALIIPNAFGYFGNIPALTTFAAGIFVTIAALNKE